MQPGFFFGVAFNRERANGRSGQLEIDWFLWQPCIGIPDLCPPLCTWEQLNDGTYSIADVKQMNNVMEALVNARKKAMAT